MPIQKEISPIKKLFEKRIYTDAELSALDKEINEKYMVFKTFRNGKTGHVFQEEQFMKDKGAMTKEGRILVPHHTEEKLIKGEYVTVDVWGRCKYQEYRSMLDQWIMWLGRKEYGKQKSLEDIAEYI